MISAGESWGTEGTVRIALLGEVAAGQPLEMFSVEETLDVPESLWKGRRVFALRVRGRSMVDAGIHDGDYLIVEPCETAADGRTVVAEIDGHVTVKKLFREPDGRVRLQPANPEMLPLRVGGDDVRIRGVVVGVLRKYGFRTPGPDVNGGGRSADPARKAPARDRDETTLDLALNAIDTVLARARVVGESTALAPGERTKLAGLVRDLQALREWTGRTSKAGLRRALIADAVRLVRRIQRILSAGDPPASDVFH